MPASTSRPRVGGLGHLASFVACPAFLSPTSVEHGAVSPVGTATPPPCLVPHGGTCLPACPSRGSMLHPRATRTLLLSAAQAPGRAKAGHNPAEPHGQGEACSVPGETARPHTQCWRGSLAREALQQHRPHSRPSARGLHRRTGLRRALAAVQTHPAAGAGGCGHSLAGLGGEAMREMQTKEPAALLPPVAENNPTKTSARCILFGAAAATAQM